MSEIDKLRKEIAVLRAEVAELTLQHNLEMKYHMSLSSHLSEMFDLKWIRFYLWLRPSPLPEHKWKRLLFPRRPENEPVMLSESVDQYGGAKVITSEEDLDVPTVQIRYTLDGEAV